MVKRSEQKWETKALSSIESPALAQALEYWRSLCDGPGFPGRKQLDPMEMRSYLPKILLICINDDGDFYYRLCGTEIARFNGADVTGKKVGSDSVGKGWRHLIHYYKKPLKRVRQYCSTVLSGGRTANMYPSSRSCFHWPKITHPSIA